ncbi:hypothetical protein [Epilithonimonas mollis]|uniref:Uncharacterized protein n=1 Tax=Epilithonimonas mollis TaxID=216903 RepID=A0A1M6SGI7_9FLAO|nr:hypothetical protein [Epilithonimonas mollis]SHK43852.1 hypothetical protein SAMN05444371_2452 [Epilithonimonas mollis]
MAKLRTIILFFIIFCFSIQINCQQEVKQNIIEINPKTSIKPFEKNWANKNIAEQWIEIKKDKKGYLIYQPCDGNTFFIDWKTQPGIVEIRYQIEPEFIKYDIREDINSTNKFFIDFSKDKKQILQIKVTGYDLNYQIALFKIDDKSYLMTPFENKDSFRKIENKCKKEKVSELEFLPID